MADIKYIIYPDRLYVLDINNEKVEVLGEDIVHMVRQQLWYNFSGESKDSTINPSIR